MFKALNEIAKMLFGYSVYSTDYDKQHFSWNIKDALDWMKCYHADDFVVIKKCFSGDMVCIRGTQY